MKKKIKLVIAVSLMFGVFLSSCKKSQEQTPASNYKTETQLAASPGKSIEELSSEYFRTHSDEKESAEKLILITKDFLSLNKGTQEFGNKKPCHIQPIYAYGIDGVAYYEIWFTEDDKTVKGWLLASATDKDLPLLNFSNGIPYSSKLTSKAIEGDKIYRFGVSYFVLERNGQKIAEYGQMPETFYSARTENGTGGKDKNGQITHYGDNNTSNLREGIDYFSVTDYESLKTTFPSAHFTDHRAQESELMQKEIENRKSSVANARVADAYSYEWVDGTFCYYTQIAPYSLPYNNFACYSGCNNNAWASLYGWWDLNRGKANLIPTTAEGETSPRYRNTVTRRASIDPVIRNLRTLCGTYCQKDIGMTKWSNMYKGYQYAGNLGYGYETEWYYCNSSKGCHVNLANIVTDGIANKRTPVIIGANSHMYVGYGYAQMPGNTRATWAYCYPAWQENHDDDVWISWYDFNASSKMFVY
jgi:hypothetical protein